MYCPKTIAIHNNTSAIFLSTLSPAQIMKIYTGKHENKIAGRAVKSKSPAQLARNRPESLISGKWFNANTFEHFLVIQKLKYDPEVIGLLFKTH